jgi:hypothetical protein
VSPITNFRLEPEHRLAQFFVVPPEHVLETGLTNLSMMPVGDVAMCITKVAA